MKTKTGARILGATVLLFCLRPTAGMPIETVPVGHPDNGADYSGYGAVGYEYRIGTYEVTAGQYTEFLNAVAACDDHFLYSTEMVRDTHGCGIERTGSPGDYAYSVAADRANRPVNQVNWGDAARFANWLHNGCPTGPQDLSTTEDGAYLLNGATTNAALLTVVRQPDWTWSIPSEDEWYKAAYHKNDGVTAHYFDYPCCHDTAPDNDLIDPDPGNHATFRTLRIDVLDDTIGAPHYRTVVGAHENSPSPYGTFDQGGNVWEWNEELMHQDINRGLRGGAYWVTDIFLRASTRYGRAPTRHDADTGFRVCQIPEPGSIALIALMSLGLLARRCDGICTAASS